MTSRVRLLCFPYAGGNAQVYAPWRRQLPASVEVCPLQPPGRGERLQESPHHRLEPLLDDLFGQVSRLLDAPVALFGHSLGALLAFECARRMVARRGIQPVWLFASGHRAPHLPLREAVTHGLSDDELVAKLQEQYSSFAVLENQQFRDMLLPMVRADFTVSETYVFADGPVLRAPITALGGRSDPGVTASELDGWARHTTGSFDVQRFHGDHFFVDQERALVLSSVSDRLRFALEGSEPGWPDTLTRPPSSPPNSPSRVSGDQ